MNNFNKTVCYFILPFSCFIFVNISALNADKRMCNLPPVFSKQKHLTEHTGYYRNYTYGYSIVIPEGLVGKSSPLPMPQHGVGILLSMNPIGYLFVDGSYNSVEWKSSEKAAEEHIEFTKNESEGIISVQKNNLLFNNIEATRILVKYKCPNADMYRDMFIFIDNRGIVYKVVLRSVEKKYNDYKKIMDQVIDSWKEEEIK